MAKPTVGHVVRVDFGDGEGEQYGLLVKDGGDKDIVVPLNDGKPVAYREPDSREGKGSGVTYWSA